MGKFITSEFHRISGIYEPVESVVEYTYCDKCGSFNIDIGYPNRYFDNKLVIVIVSSHVLSIAIGLLTHSLVVCGGIGMIGLIAFVIFSWGKHLRCNSCGNENITSDNVLNYPNADMKIDVSDRSITKRFIKTIVY